MELSSKIQDSVKKKELLKTFLLSELLNKMG